MTAQELINILKQFNPETEVLISTVYLNEIKGLKEIDEDITIHYQDLENEDIKGICLEPKLFLNGGKNCFLVIQPDFDNFNL